MDEKIIYSVGDFYVVELRDCWHAVKQRSKTGGRSIFISVVAERDHDDSLCGAIATATKEAIRSAGASSFNIKGPNGDKYWSRPIVSACILGTKYAEYVDGEFYEEISNIIKESDA